MKSHITEEKVTVAKARSFLGNNTCNRKLRPWIVDKYALDMKEGHWTQCPNSISFYEDGAMADGQTRCHAIIKSGVPQIFPIFRGLSQEAGLNIDTGLRRSLVDNARISGINPNLPSSLVAWARATRDGVRGTGIHTKSFSDQLILVDTFSEPLAWAYDNGPRGRFIRIAPVMAALCRAWYQEPEEVLNRFCEVLSTGRTFYPEESAALVLRQYLLTHGQSSTVNHMWRETFLKTMYCFDRFTRRLDTLKIMLADEGLYPLPKKLH